MSETSAQALARHLTALRGAHGWTLRYLATKSGVSAATLSRIEQGETDTTLSALDGIASAFDVPPRNLLRRRDDS